MRFLVHTTRDVISIAFGYDRNTRKLALVLGFIEFAIQWRKRVRCYRCDRKAVMVCVHWDFWGLDGNRDPLCEVHGLRPGPCPEDTRHMTSDFDVTHANQHVKIKHPYAYAGEGWEDR